MAGKDYRVCVTGKMETVVRKPIGKNCLVVTNSLKTRTHSNVNYGVVKCVPFAEGLLQKKGLNLNHHSAINTVKDVSCVDQLSSINLVTNVPNVALDLPVGARLIQFWEKMGSPRRQPQCFNSPQGRLHPTLSVPAILDQVTQCHKLFCKSPQEPLPVGGIASAFEEKCNRTGNKSNIFGLLQPFVSSSQTQQPVETYTGPQQPQQISKDRVIRNGDSRDNKNLPPSIGVGNLDRFQRPVLPHADPEPVKEVYAFSYTGQIIPIQSPTIRPLHSSQRVHCSGQRGQVSCTTKGYKNPPVARRLVGQSQIPPNLSPALTSLYQELGWLVNQEKSELDPKQVFYFVGYRFDLREGKVRPTPERWQTLQR